MNRKCWPRNGISFFVCVFACQLESHKVSAMGAHFECINHCQLRLQSRRFYQIDKSVWQYVTCHKYSSDWTCWLLLRLCHIILNISTVTVCLHVVMTQLNRAFMHISFSAIGFKCIETYLKNVLFLLNISSAIVYTSRSVWVNHNDECFTILFQSFSSFTKFSRIIIDFYTAHFKCCDYSNRSFAKHFM